jgi:O-acetyl-ADP-ribose deacetylase (regulator of RNase III)
VTNDILLSSADAIAQGVAPNDPFHSGLALPLREKWSAMYKDFRHYCQTDRAKSGSLWDWGGASEAAGTPVRLIALLRQKGGYEHGAKPGPANAKNVNHGLQELCEWAERENVQSLEIPELCTSVGGMSWDAVAPLARQHLGSLKVPM